MIDFDRLRRSMVDSQIRPNDVTDPRILAAMLEVPRERFVPGARRELAYLDDDLMVREGSATRPARYLVEPMILARLIQALELSGAEHVLDVGGATGYSAALLSRLARTVVALEEDAEFSAAARLALADVGVSNVEYANGPLPQGASGKGPFDAILVNGSVATIPDTLLSQLKDGGRLAAVIATGPQGRATLFVNAGGIVSSRELFDAAIPALPGFEAPRGFVF
jgi:protein-L-isoaspartate(D-aspartate) O-methyltransferase